MAERRAILFDLDDTLYPVERFVMSGFRAVAATVEARYGVSRAAALETLVSAVAASRGRELQVLAERHGLPAAAVGELVDTIRLHVPELRLPELSLSVLGALRRDWRIGLVTNGRPDIQARKVRALGVQRLVDAVIYAHEVGNGAGKPDPAPFLEACRQLGAPAAATVFVGDDPDCDIAGAHAVGMKTIWLPARVAPQAARAAERADVIVASLADVPAAATRLLAPAWRAHVA